MTGQSFSDCRGNKVESGILLKVALKPSNKQTNKQYFDFSGPELAATA
jgi:hypothetical protein